MIAGLPLTDSGDVLIDGRCAAPLSCWMLLGSRAGFVGVCAAFGLVTATSDCWIDALGKTRTPAAGFRCS